MREKKTKKHSRKKSRKNGDIESGFNTLNAGDFATVKPMIDPYNSEDEDALTESPTWTVKREETLDDADALRRTVFSKSNNNYQFENQDEGHLGYKLSRYVRQNGKTYDDSTIRGHLQRIGVILNSNIQKKAGTLKIAEYFFYCFALLIIASSTTIDTKVESAVCGDAPEIDSNNCTAQALLSYNHCREGFLVKGVYESSIYIAVIIIAQILQFIGSKMSKSSNKLIELHNHFDRTRFIFLKAHEPIKYKTYLTKKVEFVQYITLEFWNDLGYVLGYSKPVDFLKSCDTKQAVMVDLNIRIGLYEFFIKLSNNLSNIKELDKKITGFKGQQLGATIVNTLVWRYRNKVEKSYIFPTQFKSIIDSQKILYIADAILGFKLFIKEGHVSETSIKRATLLNSDSAEELSSLASLSNKNAAHKITMLGDCKKNCGYISFSQGLKQRNNYERATTFSNPEVIVVVDKPDSSLRKRRSSQSEKRINNSGSKSNLSHSYSQNDLSDKDIQLLCSDKVINQYTTDCASNTFDNVLITQNTLNYVFSKWKDIQPTMSEMKKFQSHINKAILNHKLPWNSMYGVYSFVQALLINLPILSIKDASFMKIEAQLPLNVIAVIAIICSHLAKNAMQKDRNRDKTNMENLESNLQNLIIDNWILLSEESGKLIATKSVQYMNFISTCTVYLICKKHHKSNIDKFDDRDLVSLVTFIWMSLIEFYNRDDLVNFEIQEKEQVKYIIEHLHLNMQSCYGLGIRNIMNGRYTWRISNIKNLDIDMVINAVKDSIHNSTNSSDLIEIGKLFKISNEYKALDEGGAKHFLRIVIETIRDFKIANRLKEVGEDARSEIVEKVKQYSSKRQDKINEGDDKYHQRFKDRIMKICEKAIGKSKDLAQESAISIFQT